MSRGVTPRFTTWCPEPTTPLGRDNPNGAPLEYHIRLLEAYRATLEQARPEAAARLRRRRRRQRGVLGQLVHGHARPRRGDGRGGRSGVSGRISIDEARTLWNEASDDELKQLARACATAGTSRTAPPTW